MPDDHSAVEPLLPIPNRTVKRSCADDSELRARESRKLSGSYLITPVAKAAGVFLCRSMWPGGRDPGRAPARATAFYFS